MEELSRVIYNAPHDIYLATPIAIYFFLTGISAASFIISTLAYVFGIQRFKAAGKIGAVMAPIVLSIAPLFLLYDMLQTSRFVHLMYMFNFRSPVSWGSFLLTIYPINCLIYLFYIWKENRPKIRFYGYVGIPLAIAVHGYTGFILALAKGIALWNTPLMPIYFLVSAMVSGTALLIILAVLKETFLKNNATINRFFPTVEKEAIWELGRLLSVFIAVDLFVAFSDVVMLYYTTPENSIVAKVILEGPFSNMFLMMEIGLGMVLPFIVLLIPGLNKSYTVLTVMSVLVLVGIWAMRYVTVVAGQYVPLM